MRLSALLVPVALAAAFAAGRLTSPSHASAGSARHAYTLRSGDSVLAPAPAMTCTATFEAGIPNLLCQRRKNLHHAVVFYRDRILVFHGPDNVVWSGKP